MNTNPLSFSINTISNIIKTLTKKNYKQQLSETQRFINNIGFECERHIYRFLFEAILNTQKTDKNKLSLFQQFYSDLGDLFEKPNFESILQFAFKLDQQISEYNNNNHRTPSDNKEFINQICDICKCLKFSELEKLCIFVILKFTDFTNISGFEIHKIDFYKQPHLTRFLISKLILLSDEKSLADLLRSIESEIQIKDQNHLFNYLFEPNLDDSKMEGNLPENASSLNDDQIAAMLINENTFQLNSEIIKQFNVTPKLCAKLLFALCDTRTENVQNKTQTEEVEQLSAICREFLLSGSPLTEIIQAIDSETFLNVNTKIINSKSFGKISISFQLFWQFCINLCNYDKQGVSLLGNLFFSKVWTNNIEFQFNFIQNCIKSQLLGKLLSASNSTELGAVVPHLDSLKSQPDFEVNQEMNNWKYQRVYQILMELSINNSQQTQKSILYNQIIEIFKWPIQHCPDILTLGLLNVTVNPCQCKNELLKLAIPAFLSNHPNAAIILHTIWNSTDNQANNLSQPSTPNNNTNGQWAKQVLLQSMCEYYMKSASEEQPSRLSRILDVAQDLKALSLLLNSNCYPFVIDLACLASRREYLKLDKWLLDKIHNNGDQFINACINFLNRRCNLLNNGAIDPQLQQQQQAANTSLPSETLAIMIACLNQFAVTVTGQNGQNTKLSTNQPVSQELIDTILTMSANSAFLIQKLPRQAPPGVISSSSTVRQQAPTSTANINNLTDLSAINPLSIINAGTNNLVNNSSFVNNRNNLNSINNLMSQQQQSTTNVTNSVANSAAAISAVNSQFNVNSIVGNNNNLQQANDKLKTNEFLEIKVSPETEKEADTYFQRIYNQSASGSMTVDEVLDMLKRFQDSPNKRDRDVSYCMLKNLFKEYRYFPQYPDKELLITAQLFGGIIQTGIAKYMPLVVALRNVLEALRSPFNSKMYFFGITALDRFKTRLKEYPLYCQHLINLPNFNEFPQHIIEYINYGKQSQEPPPFKTGSMVNQLNSPTQNSLSKNLNQSLQGMLINNNNVGSANSAFSGTINSMQTAAQLPTSVSTVSNLIKPQSTSSVVSTSSTSTTTQRPSIANATNIDTLLAAGDTIYQTPSEAIQDKVAFIINNLSQINLQQKTEEFKEVIGKDNIYYDWIAQYFVMKRASIEPNFHSLYANFIEVLKLNELTKIVIKETYRNIKVLLRSNKEIANFSDRSLLKNLGHWLGLLTLAKNKPILAIDLNIKYLLIEAYHKGIQELLYVVPFIAKVLESCAKSKVFKPPNPWTMGIVKVLIELHQEPDLKLNLKFEVEVLSKTLNVDITKWIGKTNVLKNEEIMNRVMSQQQLSGIKQQPHAQTVQLSNNIANLSNLSNMPQVQQLASQMNQINLNPQQLQGRLVAANANVQQQAQQPSIQQLASLTAGTNTTSAAQLQQTTAVSQQSLLPPSSEHGFLPNSTSPTISFTANGQSVMHQLNSQVLIGPSSNNVRSFNYNDININNPNCLSQFILIPSNLPLLQLLPNLKQWVRPAIERVIQELMQSIVERSTKSTIVTAESLIKKDFALESDENKMCLAAQYLIRNLTAGMAMISCKETLFISIKNGIITAFNNLPNMPTNQGKDLIEATANSIAAENIDLAVCFIQKAAIEKAIADLDKRLAPEYETRRKARQEGRRYFDPATLSYQVDRMPEKVRLRAGSVTQQQFQIYEELGRSIPGFTAGSTAIQTPSVNSNIITQMDNMNSLNQIAPQFMKQISNQVPNSQLGPISRSNNVATMLPTQNVSNVANYANDLANPGVDPTFVALLDKLVAELESLLQQFMQVMQPNQLINSMHSIFEYVVATRNNPNDVVNTITLIQKVLDVLNQLVICVDNPAITESNLLIRARDLYIVILKGLNETKTYGSQWITKQVTRIVLDRILTNTSNTPPLPDELFDTLLRSALINIPYLDHHLVSLFESTSNPIALAFTLQFVKMYGHTGIQEQEIPNIIAALIKLSKTCTANPLSVEIQQILDNIRSNPVFSNNSINPNDTANFIMPTSMNQVSNLEADSPEFSEKTEKLLREWINLYNSPANLDKVFTLYVQSMNHQGILKTDDSITRFFRLSTELCVNLCYRFLSNLNGQQHPKTQSVVDAHGKCFYSLDAFANLIVMLVKHSGSNTGAATESSAKLNLLNKVLTIIAAVAIQDQESRGVNFQHLPYFRIYFILFMELTLGPNNFSSQNMNSSLQHHLGFGMMQNQLDPFFETIQFQVLNAFCNTLRLLKPNKVPSFAFAWLDFIAHRTFMEKCLNGPNPITGSPTKGWPHYAQLLIELIKFEAPFLRNVKLISSVDLLYRGTLKVFLVLLHDFPEFLCEYCYELCDAIPSNAIQMRNLVLSAFPRNMRLPDPFTPTMNIDALPEITQPPKSTMTINILATVAFKKDLDSYIRTRGPVTFLSDLRGYLQQPSTTQSGEPSKYNIPLINALVLYVGQAAIQSISPKNISITTIAHSSHMDIFQNLAVDLDTEGRYLFLNAIANQMRYPNSNTHYFSCTLLYLFAESNTEAIQEQITRVLLERLIVNRPHPWGLLVTFIELIKNPIYNFWKQNFLRSAPEIEAMFSSVAKSCLAQQQSKTIVSENTSIQNHVATA